MIAETLHYRLCDLPVNDDLYGDPDPRMVKALRATVNLGEPEYDGIIRLARLPDGRLAVRDGSRSIMAMRAAGFPDDFVVECSVIDIDEESEWIVFVDRLKFNAVRSKNPIDEYAAVLSLLQQEWSIEAIVANSGMRKSQVQAYARIGSDLLPDLRRAWLNGEITFTKAAKLARRPMTEQRAALAVLEENEQLTDDDMRTLRRKAAHDAGQQVIFDDEEEDYGEMITGVKQHGKARIRIGNASYTVDATELLEWLAGSEENE